MEDDIEELDRLPEDVLGPLSETSAPRVQARALDDILGSQLTSVGFVTHQRTLTHAIHQLREDHPLASPMRSLFDGEIRAAES